MTTKAELIAKINNQINGAREEFKSAKAFNAFKAEMESLISQFATRGTKSGGAQYPNVMFDGIEYKWCKRHLQYEQLDQFFYDEKKGRHHPECGVAKAIWVEHGKTISKLEREMSANLTNADFDLRAHALKIQEAKDIRAGHDYDRTGTEDFVLPEGAQTTPVADENEVEA